jgi:hypothetical protein
VVRFGAPRTGRGGYVREGWRFWVCRAVSVPRDVGRFGRFRTISALIRFAIVCTTIAYAGILAAAECRCAVAGFRAAL